MHGRHGETEIPSRREKATIKILYGVRTLLLPLLFLNDTTATARYNKNTNYEYYGYIYRTRVVAVVVGEVVNTNPKYVKQSVK